MSSGNQGDIDHPFDITPMAKDVENQAKEFDKLVNKTMPGLEQTARQYVAKKNNIRKIMAEGFAERRAASPGQNFTPRMEAGRRSSVGYLYNNPETAGGTSDPLMQGTLGPQGKGEAGGSIAQLSRFTSSLKEAVVGIGVLKGAAITTGAALAVGGGMANRNAAIGAQAGGAIGDINALGEQAFRHLGVNPRGLTELLGSSRKGADRVVSTAVSMKTQRNMNVTGEHLMMAVQAVNNMENPDDVINLMQAGNWGRIAQYARKQIQWAPAQESATQERVGNYAQWRAYNSKTSVDQRRRGAVKNTTDFLYDSSAYGQFVNSIPGIGDAASGI